MSVVAFQKKDDGGTPLSDNQIRLLFAEIRKILDALSALGSDVRDSNARVDSLEKAVNQLRATDDEHWSAIDTGRFVTDQLNELVNQHEQELKKEKRKSSAKAAIITAPTVAALIEIVRMILENM